MLLDIWRNEDAAVASWKCNWMHSGILKCFVVKILVYFHVSAALLTKLKICPMIMNGCCFLIKTNVLLQ